ncbi:MAG: GDSL-type esterase/lipase family protein [Chloroflexota bacterium]
MQASTDLNQKLLLVVLFTVILFSGLINYRSYQLTKQYERFFGANLLDPFNLTMYPADTAAAQIPTPTPGNLVVFFGDSRALKWPAPTYEDERWQFINRGINAQTSIQVAGRFEHHIAPLDADIVVIQVGVNDLRLIPMFPNQRERIIANTKASIEQVVARANQSGSKVILSTILPVGKPNFEQKLLGENVQIITAVRDVNNHIRSLARPNVVILDADPIIASPNGIARLEYRSDFLHINQRAYARLNKALMDILMKLE